MSTSARRAAALSGAALLIGAGVLLARAGLYGLTIFMLFPMLLGGLASWVFQPRSAGEAAAAGVLANATAGCLLLALGMEGAICVLMSLPLALPLGALGGFLFYREEPSRVGTGGLAALLLLPAAVTWDIKATPPEYEVRTAVEIAAPAEQVWRHVVTFSEIPEAREWFFRAGLAYPKRARIEGSGAGAIRYCEFSTGAFVEPIEIWDEPRLLRFRVTENPAPMQEWSPYGEVRPRHLHGYLVSKQGEFRLTPLGGGRTLLAGTTWYQHGLWPAQYWRWWSDAIIHRIHLRVLRHIRMLAENGISSTD